jgi:large subunit ribosomal protein L25
MAKPSILKTENRPGTGSRVARRSRAAGHVPVNVYGHGEANQNLAIDEHALSLALNTNTQVFTLSIDGKEQPCLVKHVQWDTYSVRVLHVDFVRVSLTEEVEVEVKLNFTGHAKGLNEGGIMAVHHPALWVRCPAASIPDSIDVDVSELEMGHALRAQDIKLPAGVKLDTHKVNPTDQIVGVVAPRIEVVEPTPEEVAAAEAAAAGVAPAEGEAAAAGAAPGAEGKPGAAPAAGAKPGAPAAGGKPGAPAAGGKPAGGAPGKDKGKG